MMNKVSEWAEYNELVISSVLHIEHTPKKLSVEFT